jgi:hypothetical protein
MDDRDPWEGLVGLTSRMDPVPENALEMARESLAWREPDVALARLVEQSLSQPGVRGDGLPELLTFTAGELTIEVEIGDGALVGQLVPPQPARIRVDHSHGPTWVDADALGRFSAEGISSGHLRLTCHPAAGGGAVQTAWTLV